MVIQFVKIQSDVSDAEQRALLERHAAAFRAVPGLIQKFYGRELSTNQFGAFYVFDSRESMIAFWQSELARGMRTGTPAAEPPRIELFDVLFALRPTGDGAAP